MLFQAYLEQALKFRDANIGLYRIGAQYHFPAETAPDDDEIQVRDSFFILSLVTAM
jgi:hypothetical protein